MVCLAIIDFDFFTAFVCFKSFIFGQLVVDVHRLFICFFFSVYLAYPYFTSVSSIGIISFRSWHRMPSKVVPNILINSKHAVIASNHHQHSILFAYQICQYILTHTYPPTNQPFLLFIIKLYLSITFRIDLRRKQQTIFCFSLISEPVYDQKFMCICPKLIQMQFSI